MNKCNSLALVIIVLATISLVTAAINTEVFAAKKNDKGADVQKGFSCGVFDENGNVEITDNSHSVVTPSGKSNLHCKG